MDTAYSGNVHYAYKKYVSQNVFTTMCHLRGQNLANAVFALLHPEHGTLYRYISVRQLTADNSSSLGSKLIFSNAPTYDFYLRELLRSELTYLLTYLLLTDVNTLPLNPAWLKGLKLPTSPYVYAHYPVLL